MIKLPEGELRDYLPASMKNDVDMICLSYAIKKETEQLVKYRKAAMIYRFIDSVPEPILDLLAAELRSLYYSDALPIETKRNIVKNTLRWHTQAGTPGAVEEMIRTIFGEGEIVEWPDYDDPPYIPGTFDIVTEAKLTPDILEYFLSIINRVKNARSHLRKLIIRRETTQNIYFGAGMHRWMKPPGIMEGYSILRMTEQTVCAGIQQQSCTVQSAAEVNLKICTRMHQTLCAGTYPAVRAVHPAAVREEGLHAAAI